MLLLIFGHRHCRGPVKWRGVKFETNVLLDASACKINRNTENEINFSLAQSLLITSRFVNIFVNIFVGLNKTFLIPDDDVYIDHIHLFS